MLLLALALATMPVPVTRWMSDLTTLGVAAAYDRPAAVRTELTVDPTGHPVHCEVVRASPVRRLDRATCDYLLRTARFTPARDATGTPTAAVVRLDTSFNQPSLAGPGGGDAGQLDFAVQVTRVPRPGTTYVADLVLTTTADGRVAACDVARSSGVAPFDAIGCRQMTGTSFAPARDARGQPLAALRHVSIGFTAAPVAQ